MKSYRLAWVLVALLSVSGGIGLPAQIPAVREPVLSVAPPNGDFGALFPGESRTLEFTLRNTGISVLKILRIEVEGEAFSLEDTNPYPFEILSDSAFPFPGTNNGKLLKFNVRFQPQETGNIDGRIVVTYGLYEETTHEIVLSGISLDCTRAEEAHVGINVSPGLNTWYRYTADKYSIVEISACDSMQPNSDGDPSKHIFLNVYDGCDGPRVPEAEEWTGSCPYDPDAIPVQLVMQAGQTIYLFWPLEYPDNPYRETGFRFHIEATYPADGDVCENAVPLTLPVINHFGSTRGLNDDYDLSPCFSDHNYLSGNDKVYTVAIERAGYLNATILGAYASVHVLDICPKEELGSSHCIAFAGGPEGGGFHRRILPGTYFVIVSNWAPPQSVDYLLNMSWEDASSANGTGLAGRIRAYPNPALTSLWLEVDQSEELRMTIELVDPTGRTVYREDTEAVREYRKPIDVAGLARGIYCLKIGNGRGIEVRKVILE